jgi:small subunit ribosomal protein S6
MNHYETVFILNPVLSDVQVKASKFEDFLTTRGATMVSERGLGPGLRNSKQKSGFYHLFEFNVPGEVLLLLKQNLDVTKELCVSNRKSR